MRIYVRVSFKTDEQTVIDKFEQFGEVKSCKIITDRETGRSRGFGFVEMTDRQAGEAAIAGLDGIKIDGWAWKVTEAQPPKEGGR